VIAGVAGAVLGDSISFWLGQKFGPVLPRLWPFRSHPDLLTRGIVFFERYGGSSVFVGRFIGPLRAVVPLAAGMMHMPTARFYAANILSAVVWAPALVFPVRCWLGRYLETKISQRKSSTSPSL
jgi:membrane protein DedA with SNARE-associated domain